ncbi:hypothetical protein NECID01_1429 [Nematocida sp. AWRm77]|nr:hypothetical protein NECID01_1429 [Nematocida sp. AWRm77]
MNGLVQTFGMVAEKGGAAGKVKDIAMLIVGAELSILGLKYMTVNLAIVLGLETYQRSLLLLTDVLEKLASMKGTKAEEFANYIMASEWRVLGVLFALTILIAAILIMLIKFFLKLVICICSVFIFSEGFGKYCLVQIGIINSTARMVIGLVFGILIVVFLETKVKKFLLSFVFAITGVYLMFVALNELMQANLEIPNIVFADATTYSSIQSHVKESLMYFISVGVSMLTQIMVAKE